MVNSQNNNTLGGYPHATGQPSFLATSPPIDLRYYQKDTSYLSEKHFKELQASGINESLILLNAKTLSGDIALNRLLYSSNLPRRNTGRISDSYLRRYRHVEKGGWWASGLDPLNGCEPMEWGCFKPDSPRQNRDDAQRSAKGDCALRSAGGNRGKLIKYEHPPQEPTRAFFCNLGYEDALNIAHQLGRKSELMALFEAKSPEVKAGSLNWGQVFWQWVESDPSIPIVITEGFKKGAALMSHGVVAIALPGVTGGARTDKDESGAKSGSHLIPEIELFAVNGRKLIVAFDQDEKPKTISNVNRERFKLGHLLTKAGCEVAIASWNPSDGKGIDDLIVNRGADALIEVLDSARPFKLWSRRSHNTFTFKPNVEFNSRYFGSVEVPEDAKLIAIKGEKGTGKTKAIADILKQSEQPVLAITHLRSLCKEIANRLGIQDIGDIRGADSLVERRALKALGDREGQAIVINSAHSRSNARFRAEDYSDHQIVLDEFVQLLDALLNSNTCREFRASILTEFTKLIRGVLSPDSLGRLIVSDADLSNKEVFLLLEMAGCLEIEPFIILNQWKPDFLPIAYKYKDDIHLLEKLGESLKAGQKAYVFSDCQKPKNRSSSTNLERWAAKNFPSLKVLRIDSDTIERRGHPAFGCLSKLNDVVSEYDLVIVSPSVQTGVSIDLKGHFDAVFGFLHGVVSVDTARQALARVREPIPRHFCVPALGLTKIGGGELNADELRASQKAIASSTFKAIGIAGSNLMETAKGSQDIWLGYWSDRAAESNRGRIFYREYLINGMLDEGWQVVDVEPDDPERIKTLKRSMLENRDEAQRERGEAIANADLIDDRTAKLLEDCPHGVTEEEQRERDKHCLHSKYGGIEVTPDLYLKDCEKWHPKLAMHYFLTVGRDRLEQRDRIAVDKLSADGRPFLPDVPRVTRFAKIEVLNKLGFRSLLEDPDFKNKEWRNSDRHLIELRASLLAYARDIQRWFGVKLLETDTPIRTVTKMFKLFGLPFHCDRKEGGRGAQERVYRLQTLADFEETNRKRAEKGARMVATYIGIEDGRDRIFESWLSSVVTECSKDLIPLRDYKKHHSTTTKRVAA